MTSLLLLLGCAWELSLLGLSVQCLHGDLTCRNILLNGDRSVAKIGDLGLSKMVQSTITELALGGTLAFAAPEVLLNMRCNEKVRRHAACIPAQDCADGLGPWCQPRYGRTSRHICTGAVCAVAHILPAFGWPEAWYPFCRRTCSPLQWCCGPSAPRRSPSGVICGLSG